jgi:hypothetical protein
MFQPLLGPLLHGPHWQCTAERERLRAYGAEGSARASATVPCWLSVGTSGLRARISALMVRAGGLGPHATNATAAAVLAAVWAAAGAYYFAVPRLAKPETLGPVWVERCAGPAWEGCLPTRWATVAQRHHYEHSYSMWACRTRAIPCHVHGNPRMRTADERRTVRTGCATRACTSRSNLHALHAAPIVNPLFQMRAGGRERIPVRYTAAVGAAAACRRATAAVQAKSAAPPCTRVDARAHKRARACFIGSRVHVCARARACVWGTAEGGLLDPLSAVSVV